MVRILPDESEEDATSLTEALAEGDEGTIVTDKTPFYATMGGQQGDVGVIEAGNNRFAVRDTIHLKGGKVGHTGKVLSGMFRIGETVTLAVDAANRENTAKNRHASLARGTPRGARQSCEPGGQLCECGQTAL